LSIFRPSFGLPKTDDIPLYPGAPEHAYVGDIPQEEDELLNTVSDEPAALFTVH
jgi:hypothetical protein